MGFLRAYLKQHRGTACLWAGFCAVFFILFTLYRLPPGAVLYGTALTEPREFWCLLPGI